MASGLWVAAVGTVLASAAAVSIFLLNGWADLLPYVAAFSLVIACAWLIPSWVAEKEERDFLVSITVLSVFLRVLFAVLFFSFAVSLDYRDGFLMGNAAKFDRMAWGWAQDQDYDEITYRAPGILYLLGFSYKFLSHDVHRPVVPLFFVALGGGLVAPFTYKFASKLFSPQVGRWAALAVALHPEFFYHATVQIREQMIAAGLALALWGAALLRERLTSKGAAAAVAGLLVVFFFNPSFGFPAIAVFTLVVLRSEGFFGYAVARSAVIFGVIGLLFLLLGASIIANRLLDHEYDEASAVAENLSGQFFVSKFFTQIETTLEEFDDENAGGLAERYISNLPSFLRSPLHAAWGLFLPVVPQGTYGWLLVHIPAYFMRSLGWHITLPFLLYGIIATACREKFLLLALFVSALLIGAGLTSIGIWDSTRYRSFGAPLFAVMMALAWLHGVHLRKSRILVGLMGAVYVFNMALLGIYSIRYGGSLQVAFDLFGGRPLDFFMSFGPLFIDNALAIFAAVIYTAVLVFFLEKVKDRAASRRQLGISGSGA